MLERLPYFRFAPADYLLDTLGLSQREHGAYMLMMLHYYWNGYFPTKRTEIYLIACATDEEGRRAADTVTARFFHDENGALVHHRIERELEKLRDFFHKQSVKGKASAEARSKKTRPQKGNGAHPSMPELNLPSWLDAETFRAWIQIRPSKARTPSAQLAAIDKLTRLREQGHDANAIVKESLANGWQGIFAPSSRKGRTPLQGNVTASQEWLRREETKDGQH